MVSEDKPRVIEVVHDVEGGCWLCPLGGTSAYHDNHCAIEPYPDAPHGPAPEDCPLRSASVLVKRKES